ncbi:lissencephaly-1 homolog [Cucurbita moschata]|uniref:Lissencephaly-1 homolog n=1 Tax=Cucurbita moschata TaxID=3662 RepID=A0A6J1HDZ0_CUCMO|nr:lissencephaly-1 homolog [Cucurbita moschata]XP_022962705.1 lissencephaly-1 homolog [Cucurbita moschata]XP_022962706.1 lissencephaly-1 homolog [Cucurbita moschata]
MLSSDRDTDVFFDSEDYLPLEDSLVAEEVGSNKLGYEIWMSEPQSIKRRRQRFLQEVGLLEFASSRTCAHDLVIESSDSSGRMELERLTEFSGAVSSSDYAPTCNVEENDLELCSNEMLLPVSVSNSGSRRCHGEADVEGCRDIDVGKRKIKKWWRSFKNKAASLRSTEFSEELKTIPAKSKTCRMKVYQNKKRCSEFSALYMRQQIVAHKGLIWTMKFSPDGKYLASGGEDGVVRVWRISSANASTEFLANDGNYNNKPREGKSSFSSKPLRFATVVIPEKVFQIDEQPVQEFYGHSSDVLDIAWSNSNCLLSSSKDKTVRLWGVGSDQCLGVFHHKNYVTCIQFNPMDENYFISGSIDGKIRVWSVLKQRVVDWADVRDVITALAYQPDGKGFAIGSITGTCRFYKTSGDYFHLDAQINVQGRKKASGKRITGIQFCRENSQRVMITSEDSKVRIFEGTEIVNKYKGLPKSGSQMSASFTKNGKHIISVGEDSRVYMWNYDSLHLSSMKETKSQQSCEHFLSDGASVAIPWPGLGTELKCFGNNQRQFSQRQDNQGASERFSLANWFSADNLCRGSTTWPEERLPLWDLPVADDEHGNLEHHNSQSDAHDHVAPPDTWGLVIVVAGLDGTIKTFHNYGLPIRL